MVTASSSWPACTRSKIPSGGDAASDGELLLSADRLRRRLKRALDDVEEACVPDFELSKERTAWASTRRQGVGPKRLRDLLASQDGRCALSNVPMLFDLLERTPERNGRGCHPLSPAVDHVEPGHASGRRQLVCDALNDLKGHLPAACFEA